MQLTSHFSESFAATFPRACQSEELWRDWQGRLGGSGHAPAASASRHLCWRWLVFLWHCPALPHRAEHVLQNTPPLAVDTLTAEEATAPLVAHSAVRLWKSFLRAQPQVCFFTYPTNSISRLIACNKSPSAETSQRRSSSPQVNLDWYNHLLQKKVWNSLKPQWPLPWGKKEVSHHIYKNHFLLKSLNPSALALCCISLGSHKWRAVIIQEVTEV